MIAEAGSRSARKSSWVKLGLSLLIAFHFSAILIAPNSQNYLGALTRPIIEPYLSFLELVSTWNFFAPDPGPPPVFIEWETLDQNGDTVARGKIPEYPDPYIVRERQNRRIAAARFMQVSNERAEKMMVPYLCKGGPGIRSVRLWKTVFSPPSLLEIREGKRTMGDETGAVRSAISHNFCEDFR